MLKNSKYMYGVVVCCNYAYGCVYFVSGTRPIQGTEVFHDTLSGILWIRPIEFIDFLGQGCVVNFRAPSLGGVDVVCIESL